MNRATRWMAILLAWSLSPPGFAGEEKLVVHEWGTFTSLQDEAGRTIPWINTDDEPVPRFVHDLAPNLLIGARIQGAPKAHPHVTMRLETPVIYFHLPPSGPKSMTVDVDVAFEGGWLTQFYPVAQADAPGLAAGHFHFGALTPTTRGTLFWKNLQIGNAQDGPPTSEHVWTAPRAVDADAVKTAPTMDHKERLRVEHEKFLFYRGVGHIDAPIRVSRESTGKNVRLQSQLRAALNDGSPLPIQHLWLVSIRPDGSSALRVLNPISLSGDSDEVLAEVSAEFSEEDYQPENGERLRRAMHEVLIGEGLFNDEASALLNTWELSYFKSWGTRLFFIVPLEWTDHHLPLNVSVAAEITRVMVGRIELVTPRHRDLLRQLATAPGRTRWGLFKKLGRFGHALVLNEVSRHPASALKRFAERGDIRPFEIQENAAAVETDGQVSAK